MTITERHVLDDLIFRTVHDSDMDVDALKDVCDRVIHRVNTETKFSAEDTGCGGFDFRIIRIDTNLHYKVIRNLGWRFYDVVLA